MICTVSFQNEIVVFQLFNCYLSWIHIISFLDYIIHNVVYNIKRKHTKIHKKQNQNWKNWEVKKMNDIEKQKMERFNQIADIVIWK